MIISHANKYILLEPVGTESHLCHIYFRNLGLIEKNDIATALFQGDQQIFASQNFEPLTLSEYQKTFGLNNYAREPIESIMRIVNAALTPHEMLELGLIREADIFSYRIFAPIRNPLDRFCSQIAASKWCRPIAYNSVFTVFTETLFNNRFTHLLWQDLAAYHKLGEELIAEPILFENLWLSLHKILYSLGISEAELNIPHRNAYSCDFMIDRQIGALRNRFAKELKSRYQEDLSLWRIASDNFEQP